MPKSKSLAVLTILLALVLINTVIGQTSEVDTSKYKLSILAGYSPLSVKLLGKTPNTQTTITQIRYQRRTSYSFKGVPIYYQIGITPYIYYDYEKRDDGGDKDIASGFGFSPIGFASFFSLSKSVGIQLNTSGGIMIMNQDFPTDKGRQFNFTFEIEPSLTIANDHFISFAAGYKFHHISNAQTGTQNPGVDSNFLFFSIILSQ